MRRLRPAALALVTSLCLAAGSLRAQDPGTWTVVPVPVDPDWWTAELTDVSALAGDDAWAVGSFKTLAAGFQIETFTLAMHWDGATWTQVPTPSPSPYPGGTKAYLHSVAAVAPDDVWAGGERHGDAGGLSVGAWIHVQHWDGSSWEVVPTPQPPGGVSINFSGTRILDVLALASDDVWFGGQWGEPNAVGSVTWRPLAMHWDGSELEILPTPAPQDDHYGFKIVELEGLASDDVWAVCARIDNGETTRNVVLHWDGTSWSQVDVPDTSPPHDLRSVAVTGPDDVWVFGDDWLSQTPLALHYDGSSWTEVADPPFAETSHAVAPDAIWVGSTAIFDSNRIELFDGEQSVFVETFADAPPQSVFGIEPIPGGGGLWAVGRQHVPGQVPWAARFTPAGEASPWTPMPGGVAGSHGEPLLTAEGALEAAATVQLRLAGLAPGASATLVVGAAQLGAPFKGGTLVPAPDLLHVVHADAAGDWQTSVAWPAGVPAGLTLYLQAWAPDSAAVLGFSASDALAARTP